ncbi:type IV pilin-like G/H family protein [Pseudanabaena sp. 'Roaring Creek']|uniref:type IV pilin-like G/H family protein n=1 Tax=Pseudanabaena sp. 'Roaring Creek' TaxID=1681830 RepID=UPI0006D82810|nr:type IV pilin-like G/H family protein [Pseudanabaena sp. 'Roaring Creek']
MKSEFKTKLIQHILNKKNGEKGFTLIELLVVIIIIGILAAIALPSFLNQASKARQSEAKTYVGSMNRTQQAYYLEKQSFAPDLATLAVGIASATANYTYITGTDTAGTAAATKASSGVHSWATPNSGTAPLKSYLGAVSIATPAGSNEATTLAVLCEANLAPVNSGVNLANAAPLTAANKAGITASAAPTCPASFTAVQ